MTTQPTSQEAATVAQTTPQTPPVASAAGGEPLPAPVWEFSPEIDKIAEALCKAQGKVGAVEKSGKNTFDNYQYSTLADYTTAIRKPCAEAGLSNFFTIAELLALGTRSTTQGKVENLVRVRMFLRIQHTSGQWIRITGYGEGTDRGDKATAKAQTGGQKSLLRMAYNLASGEDDEPENDKRPPRPEEEGDGQPTRAQLSESIAERAWSANLSDDQLTAAINSFMPAPVPHWRRLKDANLARIASDEGWGKVLEAVAALAAKAVKPAAKPAKEELL